ncbi:doublecortin domain-containing protein 2B [Thalassophryne amazonica]|uniref:doublecortin domain-containing protein 2B n=1 Tax=Thalassophryne amazonica TaxID=390379 RepID=UPI001471D95C|nr:doublecortin domain-containing protein 2B [Thalassophryne amazonica]XP_034015202.1 doublecortin domain-containing protein 2B [Thalassophryne amazonica]XP_034015203.1 doublecortin domain-containing protein 2B [Thalassophryne amazonica]XP_034015204.1 doublecortin domain-containing protein 2B [Thalassophryne amazonica]XP_034015205.1 doublecortin domain-containing protein 2B [Thalassophryne amazonica]
MAASAAAVTLLPPVKCVVVYKNGDPFYNGRRFVVNQRHVTTMESFLTEVTESIGAPLAVRNLYTPRWGHKVTDLQDLQKGGLYVAAGFERFKKVDYLNSGMKKQQPAAREETQTRVIQRPNVSAKWRKFLPVPCIIHVFRNGDILCPPFRFIVPRSVQQDLEQILSMITEKVSLRTGAVRRLCSLEGVTVSSAGELKTDHCYVAVGTERFKKLPYVELLVSKATERHFLRKRRLLQQPENRKAESGPEDRYSDSALLASPESDKWWVKSTGHEDVEAAGQQATQQRTTRRGGGGGAPVLVSEMSPTSVFFTRPVQGHKNRHQPGPPASYRAVWPSGFERSTHKKQEQLGGAEEEKTAVVPPIDQVHFMVTSTRF